LEIAHKPGNLQQTLLVIPGNFRFLTLNFLTKIYFSIAKLIFLTNDHSATFPGDPLPLYRQTDKNTKGLKKEKKYKWENPIINCV